MNIDDFFTPQHVALKRKYNRDYNRKMYKERHASLHWCDHARPEGEPISCGPSIEEILKQTQRAHDECGDEFDPRFHACHIRVEQPLDFNE